MRYRARMILTWVMIVFSVFFILALFFSCVILVVMQPTFHHNMRSHAVVNLERLQKHVTILSETYAPRDFLHVDHLDACAAYIRDHFIQAGARQIIRQPFSIYGNEYANIRALFGSPSSKRLVIGAHYDAVAMTPGADDNASGVAGLIELAYLLGNSPLPREIELVAYTLEEPPFFATRHMGSAHHVEALMEEGVDIELMIALEMIGYFSDQAESQRVPFSFLRWLYPDRGNFIALVGRWEQRHIVKRIKASMKGATDLPVYSFTVPTWVTGVDFSDHRNYWDSGYDALMVADTAFYRNAAYHNLNDTADRLDYRRMANVIIGLYEAILDYS